MSRFHIGDKICWGHWNIGEVVEIFPKDNLLIIGIRTTQLDVELFTLNAPPKTVEVLNPGDGYRAILESEKTIEGDERYIGPDYQWVHVSPGYSGDRRPYLFRRRVDDPTKVGR